MRTPEPYSQGSAISQELTGRDFAEEMIIGPDPSTSESPIVGTCITGATFVGPTHVSLGPGITNLHTGTISMA